MATIVNGPGNDGDRGAGGWIIAIVAIIILILLALFLFPSLFGDNDGNTNDVNVTLPGNTTSTNPPGGTSGTGGTDGSGMAVPGTGTNFNSTTTSTTTIE